MNTRLVLNSFYLTYVFLLTTTAITFIEALRTPIPAVRHIMNIETSISIIACYFYGLFIHEINIYQDSQRDKSSISNDKSQENNDNSTKAIPIEKINNMRYSDWVITTPFMLLALSMVLGYENKIQVKFYPFLLTLAFNFAMLGFGYSGEVGLLNKNLASFVEEMFEQDRNNASMLDTKDSYEIDTELEPNDINEDYTIDNVNTRSPDESEQCGVISQEDDVGDQDYYNIAVDEE